MLVRISLFFVMCAFLSTPLAAQRAACVPVDSSGKPCVDPQPVIEEDGQFKNLTWTNICKFGVELNWRANTRNGDAARGGLGIKPGGHGRDQCYSFCGPITTEVTCNNVPPTARARPAAVIPRPSAAQGSPSAAAPASAPEPFDASRYQNDNCQEGQRLCSEDCDLGRNPDYQTAALCKQMVCADAVAFCSARQMERQAPADEAEAASRNPPPAPRQNAPARAANYCPGATGPSSGPRGCVCRPYLVASPGGTTCFRQ